MRKKSLLSNKKGVSEIIGYVILIVIAISLSILVYSYLKVYLPKGETPQCPQDVSIQLSSYNCDSINKNISITILNTGLYKVNGAYFRIGNESQKIRASLTADNQPISFGLSGLKPNDLFTIVINANPGVIKNGTNILEMQPLIYITSKKPAICEKAVTTSTINCL